MVMLKTGGIYAFHYQFWKHNLRVTAFILHGGLTKVHALNLSAKELSTANRLKLVFIIKRLASVDASSKYSGVVLYRILRKYAPNAIKQCYRTYHTSGVKKYSLVNYGLNKEEDYTDVEKMGYSRDGYNEAKNRFVVTMLNTFTRKGYEGNDVTTQFAKPRLEDITKTDTEVEEAKEEVVDNSNDDYLGED